jgi:hypothetical protein
MDWIIRIVDKGYKTERDIYIYRKHFGGKIEVMGADNTTTIYEEGGAIPDNPTLQLSPEALQALADALDKIGITPKQGFVEGKLEATEKHLEDMRSIAFKKK